MTSRILCLTNSSSDLKPSSLRISFSPIAIAFFSLAHRAKFSFFNASTSLIKPKVHSRDISLRKVVELKSMVALLGCLL